MRLQLYDIDIQYKKGSEIYLADTLSRNFGEGSHPTRSKFEEEIERLPQLADINQMTTAEDKISKIKEETDIDEVLQAVKATIQSGWPESKNSLPPTVATELFQPPR